MLPPSPGSWLVRTTKFTPGVGGDIVMESFRMLTLEPERLKNQLATTRKRSPEMEGSSRETLKRLAISVCQRRSFLPSSIELA
jgi:hypothetical protein